MSFLLLPFSKNSIKSQVITFLVSGITLMLFIMSFITASGVNKQSRELMLSNSFQIAEGLAKQSVFPILSGSDQNAQDAVEQVLGFKAVVAAQLMLEDGTVFLSAGKISNTLTQSTPLNQQTEVMSENADSWLIVTPVILYPNNENADESELEFELIEADELEEQVVGYVKLVYSKENLIAAQWQVTLLISGVGITLGLLLIFILRFGLLKLFEPLDRLANTMQRSEQTGEHIQAEITGAKEITKMAVAYNSMMQVLDEQDESLKQHRDQLEKEVEIRTKELVTARDSALTASRHKSEFLANMSHELRTPIQSISGYCEMVTEELELEGSFHLVDDMDKIASNSDRLLSLINSVLDLAKIEAGRVDVLEAETKLTSLCDNMMDTISPLAQRNNNEISSSINTDLETIKVDVEKLEQVLINLLTNACKFTERGAITFSIFSDSTTVSFAISDTGVGLSEQQQNYIFDEFRQVDGSQSRQFSGTGLGLAISKRFVEVMKGSISVVSARGEGSTFTVRLPL